MQKPTLANSIFFTILFISCLLGSIGIFIVAVGIETGNRIVVDTMTKLIANAGWVIALFGIFNVCVWLVYRKGLKR